MWIEVTTWAHDTRVLLNTNQITMIMDNYERPGTTYIYTVEGAQGLLVNHNYNELKNFIFGKE